MDSFIFALRYYILYGLILPFYIIIFTLFMTETNVYKRYTSFMINNIFQVHFEIINPREKIENGIFISNHNSGFDNMYDSFITDATLLARSNVKYYHGLYYFIQKMYDMIYLFDNKNTNRHQVYNEINRHMEKTGKNIIYYPEGTRVRTSYNNVDELKQKIKYGLLKSIYENKKYKVQLFLSTNKNGPFNGLKEKITSKYSKPFDSNDYSSFKAFTDDILSNWFEIMTTINI